MSSLKQELISDVRRRFGKALTVLSFAAFVACSVYDDALRGGASLQSAAGAAEDTGGVPSNGGADETGGSVADLPVLGGGMSGRGGMSVSGGPSVSGGTSVSGRGGTSAGGSVGGSVGGGGASTSTSGATGLPASAGAGGNGASGGSVGGLGNGGSTGFGGTTNAGAAGSNGLELATGKAALALTEQVGHETIFGNDNAPLTRWCAASATFPQWWRVDLGAAHAVSAYSVWFEHSDRQYTYQVETSLDDLTYAVRASVSKGMGAVQSGVFPANTSARYVRITVTSTVPLDAAHLTWASFFEFSVTGS